MSKLGQLCFLRPRLWLEDGLEQRLDYILLLLPPRMLLLSLILLSLLLVLAGPAGGAVDHIGKGHPPPPLQGLHHVSFLLVLDVVPQPVQHSIDHLRAEAELLQPHVLSHQRDLLRFVQLQAHAFVQPAEVPSDELEADVGVDGGLVELGLLVLRGNQPKQFAPDLVFEQDFGALHFEAGLQQLEGDFLVGRKLLEVLDCELVLQQELLLYLLYQFLDRVQPELGIFLQTLSFVPHEDHLHDFVQSEAVFGQVLLVPLYLHHQIAEAF